MKKGVLGNFAKIHEKAPAVYEMFKNTYFTEPLWTTARGFSLQLC